MRIQAASLPAVKILVFARPSRAGMTAERGGTPLLATAVGPIDDWPRRQ
jgi:hypothetical protein